MHLRSTFSIEKHHTNIGLPGGSSVKNLPAMQKPQEAQVRYLVLENPLEQGMATHSSILTWRIPWTEEPGGLQSMMSQKVGHYCSNLAQTHINIMTYST